MKKKTFLFISSLLITFASVAQSWTTAELNAANTAKDVNDISATEKSVIMYINLARLYPKAFISNELDNYSGRAAGSKKSKKSLAKELKKRTSANALQFGASMNDLAKCFAKESGDAGYVGHNRKKCPGGYLGENCSYGMEAAKDIVMQWLIDDGISGAGHRVNCLSNEYTTIGVAVHAHKGYSYCAVADFH